MSNIPFPKHGKPVRRSLQGRVLSVILALLAGGFLSLIELCGTGAYFFYKRFMPTYPQETLAQYRLQHPTDLLRHGPTPQKGTIPFLRFGRWLEFPSDGRLLFGYFRTPDDQPTPAPVIVLCHGGFALGPDDISLADSLVAKGYAVFVPALRAENGNAGDFEMGFGEVDDVVAAMEFIAGRPETDANNVLLAGHSIGGTTALLAAELSEIPCGVFACGATPSLEMVARVVSSDEDAPYDWGSAQENIARSPLNFVKDLKCPALLAYGSEEQFLQYFGEMMKERGESFGKEIELITVVDADHFTAWPEALRRADAFFKTQLERSRPPVVVPHIDSFIEASLLENWLSELGTASGEEPPVADSALPETVSKPTVLEAFGFANWQAMVDPGPEPIDWTRLVHENSERGKTNLRFFRGNSRWASSMDFENDFHIARADGEFRIEYSNAMPNLFPEAESGKSDLAAISLDGRHFAVLTTAEIADRTPQRCLTVHRSNDGELVATIDDYDHGQFLSRDVLAVWKDDDEGRGATPSRRTGNAGDRLPPMRDRSMMLVNLSSGKRSNAFRLPAGSVFGGSPGGKYCVSITPRSDHILLNVRSSQDGTIRYTGQTTAIAGTVDAGAVDFDISADGRRLAMVGNGRCSVFDLASGACTMKQQLVPNLHSVRWVDKDRCLLLGASLVVDPEDGRVVAKVSLPKPFATLHNRPESPHNTIHGQWLYLSQGTASFYRWDDSVFHMLAENRRQSHVEIAIARSASDTLSDASGEILETSVHDWLVAQAVIPDRAEAPAEKSPAEESPAVATTRLAPADCRFTIDCPQHTMELNKALRPPQLTLYGQPLPSDLVPSGLPNGVLQGRYESQSKLSAELTIRDPDFLRREAWTPAFVDESPSQVQLETLELGMPVKPQVAVLSIAQALRQFDYPTMDHYGRTPWPYPLDKAAYNTVGFSTEEVSQAEEAEAEPAFVVERDISYGWYERFRSELASDNNQAEPAADLQEYQIVPLSHFRWEENSRTRGRSSGSLLGSRYFDLANGPELMTIVCGENDARKMGSNDIYYQELFVWRVDANGKRTTTKLGSRPDATRGPFALSIMPSGRWLAVSPSYVLFGNQDRPPGSIKAMKWGDQQQCDISHISDDGQRLLLKQKRQLKRFDIGALWDTNNWPVGFSSLPSEDLFPVANGDTPWIPGSDDVLGFTDPDGGGQKIIRFHCDSGETLWELPTAERGRIYYVTSDGLRAVATVGREVWILNLATGEVIKKHVEPGGRIMAATDHWLVRLGADGGLSLYDLDTFELRYRFGQGSVLQEPAQVFAPPSGKRIAIFGGSPYTSNQKSLQVFSVQWE